MGVGSTGVIGTETQVAGDDELIAALLGGDEGAFSGLVDRFHGSMLRLARTYVPTRADAEEVVQETWLAVLTGLERFERRSSLKTWIFRILKNRAMNRGKRERRSIPFSTLLDTGDRDEPSVPPERFLPAGERWAGHWAAPPRPWDEPEGRLLSGETLALVEEAIDRLPPAQRRVIALRDVEGWSSAEVCELMAISEANQRVLLHRARTKVRAALASHLGEEDPEPDDGRGRL
jgi:RNA polymerase sigma-70 factor (ECF subfamily)